MSIIITSEKKYCPYCFWTAVTDKTHCPVVAENIVLHNYQISVPLEVCKDDTTTQHKHDRRDLNYKPNQTVVNNRLSNARAVQGECIPHLDSIRMMQKRARKQGKIKDNHFS